MALSRGSQITEGVVFRSQPQAQSDNSSGFAARRTRTASSSRQRALVSPIDASLTLWSEGRRERVAELEEELRLRDARRRQRQQQRREEDENQEQQQTRQHRHEGESATGRDARPAGRGGGGGGGGGRESVAATPTAPAPTVAAGGAPSPTPTTRTPKATAQPPSRDHHGGGGGAAAAAAAAAVAVEGTATSTGASVRPGDAAGARDRGHPRGGSSSTTLEGRLGRWGAGWRPPALRPLPRGGEGFFSGWTHLGQPERFELVKSADRSVGPDGEPLSDPELEWAVLCLEEAEERMSAMDFSTAAGILEGVLGRCPGLTLAYYRLALCILAARGEHGSRQAKLLLDCAMYLEGAENRHLRAGVDLVLRILRNDAIPESYWSEDHPRSLGDLRALEAAVDHLW